MVQAKEADCIGSPRVKEYSFPSAGFYKVNLYLYKYNNIESGMIDMLQAELRNGSSNLTESFPILFVDITIYFPGDRSYLGNDAFHRSLCLFEPFPQIVNFYVS